MRISGSRPDLCEWPSSLPISGRPWPEGRDRYDTRLEAASRARRSLLLTFAGPVTMPATMAAFCLDFAIDFSPVSVRLLAIVGGSMLVTWMVIRAGTGRGMSCRTRKRPRASPSWAC
jgi:hypothetical protein